MAKKSKGKPEKGAAKAKVAPKPEVKAKVKEEPKKAPEETKKEFVPKEIPDACQLVVNEWKKGKFGAFDPASDSCKECKKEYPKSAEACIYNTTAQAEQKASAKKAGGNGAKSFKKAGTKAFGSFDVNSGAGKIATLLERKEGCTMDEMKACRGAVGSVLNALKGKGWMISRKDNRYFGKVPKH